MFLSKEVYFKKSEIKNNCRNIRTNAFFTNPTPSGPPPEDILGNQISRKAKSTQEHVFSEIRPAGGTAGSQVTILGQYKSRKIQTSTHGRRFSEI